MLLRSGDLRLVELAQRALRDQRLHRVAGRHQDVVAGGAGRELRQQLLVVRVVVLHELALAGRLERLRRSPRRGSCSSCRGAARWRRRAFGAPSSSPCRRRRRAAGRERERAHGRRQARERRATVVSRPCRGSASGASLPATTISVSVSSISSVDTRVDLGRHGDLDHRVDLQRQRRHAGARGEERDDEVVDRQRERHQRAGDHAGHDERQRHAAGTSATAWRRGRAPPRRSTRPCRRAARAR